MKEVNLEEILSEYADVADGYIGYDTEIKDVLRAMKEACKQVLELASENAKIQEVVDDDLDNMEISDYLVSYDDFNSCYTQSVNKQSIINTINQVK